MKITLIQTDPIWANPEQNASIIEKIVASLPQTDLIVLPEMFSTAFATRPEGIAEENDYSLDLLRRLSAERGCALAGSIAVKDAEDSTFRNRFYFVHPDGKVEYYDKHHPFSFSGEHLRFAPGKKRVVVEYGGIHILLQVCYDLRFPVFARNFLHEDGRADYDLALYVASWPSSRIDAWDTLLKARAIENQCYVAAVNRVGDDPGNNYCGHSKLIGPKGEIVVSCEDGKVCWCSAELDMDALLEFRKAFPVLSDADPL